MPSFPKEIRTRLEAGVAVADVGCGQGAAACILGEVFPKSKVHGFDYHAPSVEEGIAAAKRKGLSNVSFHVQPSDAFASDASFDLVFFLDCFHDMAVATSAAGHAQRVLRPDGVLILVEPLGAERDSAKDQLTVPTATFLSAISCHGCLPRRPCI